MELDEARLKKVFFHFDREGIGMISIDDIGQILQLMGENPTRDDIITIQDKLRKSYDTYLTYEELKQFLNTHDPIKVTHEDLIHILQSQGFVDGNNTVNMRDLKAAINGRDGMTE
jgi:Ca2+-binding EF-hand superfamily protein